jgi:hypothetical protein
MTTWKSRLLGILFALPALSAVAQIQPTQLILGGIGQLRFLEGGSRLNVEANVGAQAWTLLGDRWGIGAQVEGAVVSSALNSFRVDVGPMFRYYLRNQAEGWLPFLLATPAYSYAAADFVAPPNTFPSIQRAIRTELRLRGGIGVSRFITSTVLLELMLIGYHPIPLSTLTPQTAGEVSLAIGFQFLLPPFK